VSGRAYGRTAADRPPRLQFAETFRLAGRSLRHRNFRLFTIGQTLSLIGTWMQQVAVGWLVYRMTDSALLLGVVAFVSQGPAFLLAPFAGVVADHFNRRRIVMVTQSVMLVQAAVLAVLVLTGAITIAWIVALMAVLGAVHGFDIPARQSFLTELVGGREDLPNAIALNSSMFNAARLIGPAIAGFVVASVGEGICILINAISYVAVLICLSAMRLPDRQHRAGSGDVFGRVIEGFRYAFGFDPIRTILTLVALTSLVAVPFTVLLPVVATTVLGGDARTLGILMAATGLGALCGALFLASRRSVRGLGRVIVYAAIFFGGSLIGVALSRSLALSVLMLTGAGLGMMVQMAASNTVLQTLVDDDKRGRIMSIYSMAFIGITPLGSLFAGALASRFGAPLTIAIGGAACIAGAAAFATRLPHLRAQVRPIYERLGIIPEVATGIQAVTHQHTPEPANG
jgi:MFS family permease